MRRNAMYCAILLGLILVITAFGAAAHAAPGDVVAQWGKKPLFNYPYGMTADRSGNIYVVDTGGLQVFNSSGTRIRKVSSAGMPYGQFGPGVGVDGSGNTYMTWANGVVAYDKYGNLLRKWQTCDDNARSGYPSDLAVTSTGNVYVSDTSGRIQVFDKTGVLLRTIGSYGSGDGEFEYPMGLAFDAAGRLYVIDTYTARVQVFDSAGKFLRKWTQGNPEEGIGYATKIAIGGKGNVYVNDINSETVRIYSSTGAFLGKFRGSGAGNGAFYFPCAIAAGSSGRVYVSDATNRVQVFDAAGNFLAKWGSSGSGDGEFDYPGECAMDQKGNLYVADSNNHRIQVLSGTGAFLRKWGSYGTGDGQFKLPRAVALDRNGNVYVADATKRIQVFNNAGTFLRKWNTPSLSSIAVDDAGRVYAVGPDSAFVHVYDKSGTLITQWGGESDERIGQPVRVAVDGTKVYLSDDTHNRINVYDKAGTFLTSMGEDVMFWTSNAVAVDGSGSVYATDGNNQLYAFDPQGVERGQWYEYGGTDEFMVPAAALADTSNNRFFIVDGVNNRIQVHEGLGDNLPPGWTGRDIGDGFNLPGRSSYADGVFTLQGAGEYMADTVDFFRFTYKPFSGDGEIIARVTAVQNTSGYARGGIMIRQGLWPSGPYAMVDITAGNGAEFSSRGTDAAAAEVTKVPDVAAPYWVKLVREGNSFRGYVSPDGISWTLAGTSNVAMTGDVFVGLVVGSNNLEALCTVTLDRVSLSGQTNTPTVTITAPAAGSFYNKPVTLAVSANATAGSWATVKEVGFFSGATAIGTASSAPFSVSWRDVPSGSHSLTARVTDSLGMTATSVPVAIRVGEPNSLPEPWSTRDIGSVSMAGSTSYLNGAITLKVSGADIWGTADAFRYLYQPVTGDLQIVARVISVQNTSRYAKGGVMIRQSLAADSPHAMMDLTPGNGSEFSRRTAAGGTTSATLAAGITAPYWVKLVRTGNTFTGSISSDGVTWLQVGRSTISMAGAVYVGVIANSHNPALCSVTVDSVSVTPPGDTSAPSVTALAIPATFNSLTVPVTTLTATDNVGVIGYLVTESAATPSGAATGWSAGAPTSYTFATPGRKTLYAWAKDAAGNISLSRPATVEVSAGLPVPWLTQDIGSVGRTGSASYLNGTFTIAGAGADIYGTADSFRFVYRVMTGDGELVARVASVQNTNPYAKAGVMMRQSLTSDSMHAMLDLKPTGGAEFSRRATTGGSTSVTTKTGIAAPYWVKLVRSGNTFTGSVSSDGANWVQVGTSTIGMTSSIYVGVAVTSHSNSLLCTSVFDHLQ
jgi:regulation of enolase protein 1 (concanavalin A-like superfamily)